MSTKKLTIRDVATVVGVSYATVSRALSGSPGISEETRKQVLAACDELGYTPNSLARSLVAQESRLIGLIVGSVDNPFMGQLARHAELYARERGYNLILCNSTNQPEQEAEAFALLIGRQADGIMIVPSNAGAYQRLAKYISQTPTVFVGENLKDTRVSYVAVDNYQGTFLGAEHLISLGHRAIAYIGARPESITHQLRYEGFAAACKQHGVESCLLENRDYPFSSVESGYRLGKRFFSECTGYTAIFAATDTTAIGIIQAADECGIGVPEEVSLIGFDNIPFASLPRINLTTVNQPLEAMAAAAVDLLIDKIQDSSIGYSHKVLAPSLIKRRTCLPVGGQA